MEFLKLSRTKILNIIFLTSLISACGILDPYVDRRRNPGTSNVEELYSGESKIDAPAICYNPLLSEDNELQRLADSECIKHHTGTRAEFTKKTSFTCKVLLPNIAYYKCVK